MFHDNGSEQFTRHIPPPLHDCKVLTMCRYDNYSHRIDIWRVPLDQPPRNFTLNVLSNDELHRAGRFRFERDRLYFMRCRAALRWILACYSRESAHALVFDYQNNGKPELPSAKNPGHLQFNVSHSGDVALIVVGARRRVGIDIELIRPDFDFSLLADQVLSARERSSIRALAPNLQLLAFFSCWTRKEAFIKATGAGLSFALSDLSVSILPDSHPQIEQIGSRVVSPYEWSLADVTPANEYRATVAWEGPPVSVHTYTLD